MADAEMRMRKPVASDNQPSGDQGSRPAARAARDENDTSSRLDILRFLILLLVASCGLSYVITGGDSLFWGIKNKPDVLRVDWWKAKTRAPLYLTPEELAEFDGTVETKPLYLAINGTIYDVSNGRRIYGPGGSYHVFAGCDAARAYVTGCFQEDRTADMRGVEDMFLPIDDPEVDAHWTAAQMEELKKQELEQALQRAHDALAYWTNFFAKSKKYHMVGYVKRDPDWLEKAPRRELCAPAQNGRKKRTVPWDD